VDIISQLKDRQSKRMQDPTEKKERTGGREEGKGRGGGKR
jgi:hypothetical protein